MDFAKLGNTGMTVSRLCLGCMSYGGGALPEWAQSREWALDKAKARHHFAYAIEAGINFFDTADAYSVGLSEEITGHWLGELSSRDDIVIATKVWGKMGPGRNRSGLGRKHIVRACEDSLRRLNTDHIDLYQIHRWDFSTPLEETLEALDSLVVSGKVRYLGASSMAAWQFSKALHTAKERGWKRFVSMQNHYNLIYREEEREMNPLCIDQGIGLIPWSPLARGFFAGNRHPTKSENPTTRAKTDAFAHDNYFRENDFRISSTVQAVADERGVSPTQVACAWVLQAPGVTAPIIGATKVDHLKELIAAVHIKLSDEEVSMLEDPYQPHPILGHSQPNPRKML